MSVCRKIAPVVWVLACLAAEAQQGFYRQYYADVAGGSVANLTNAPSFPNAPTVEEIVANQLETGTNIADYYGQRVRALITPTVTGNYTFWIATDDGGELWLGTNALSASRRRIAYVGGWAGPRQWSSAASQKSALIALAAGTPYYLEVLHKENAGGDNLAVAWQVPGSSETNVIPVEVLKPFLDAPAIKTQPVSVDVEKQWVGQRTVSFAAVPVYGGQLAYQWQCDGVNIAGATQSVYTLLADLANSNRLFRCCLTNLAGSVTSAAASYRFIEDTAPPAFTGWSLSHDRRLLNLTFTEPLAPSSLSNTAFSVSGTSVLGVSLLGSATNVLVHLADSLSVGTACSLSFWVADCASPANALSLTNYVFTPAPLLPAPLPLLRGSVEPPGPASRRSPLAVTEISHTPAARADGRNLRFVELYNSNPFSQDVGGYRFSGAFDYTVPSGTVMAANSYLVVAPAPGDITAVYGSVNVIGGFAAPSFNGTGAITIKDEIGAWVTTVSYSDNPPWPVAADGAGHTLVLARPSYGDREVDGWSASARIGGSPGAAEPPQPTAFAAVILNEVMAHADPAPGFAELHNLSTGAVSLAGCVMRRGDPASAGYVIPDGTVLPAGGFLALDEATLGFAINGKGDTLWLFAPDAAGGAVIDALRFDNQEVGVAFGRYPDGAAAWQRLEAPSPASANAPRRCAEVVLNEIMYHPISEDSDDEYVELYNPATNAVDLTGWKLGGCVDYTFAETIPAGGYLIVPHSRTKLELLYPARAGAMTVGGYAGSLGNGRDTVTLSKPAPVMNTDLPETPVLEQKRVVVEEVTYRDGGEWGELADGGGSSLERIDPRSDPRLARSWAASDETRKSDWVTLSFTGTIDNGFTASTNGDPNAVTVGLMDAGECLVDAVEVKASGGANLVNNPSFEANTADWRFMGTHERSAIETDPAAPDGSRVLHLRASGRCHNSMNIARGLMGAQLAKSGTGTISVRARWLSGSPELLVRTRGSWLETCGTILTTRALGTPGQANSRASANAAPALFDVIHQPVLPRTGEKVTVYARAHDPDGIGRVTLYYHVDGQSAAGAVPMQPSAGGTFAGDIPAGMPTNALVAFYVEAEDARAPAAVARYPASAPARECLVRFSEPLDTRSFGIYRFWVTKDNVAYWAGRERGSNKPVDATFVYGTNRVIYQAGMMYSGSPFHTAGYSTPINGNVDYEAAFPSDDTLLDDDGLVLATTGNLSSDVIGVREQFCYSLVQALGLPHMYRRFVHVYANGTEQSARKIFEDTEKPNTSVLKHWFPEDPDNDFFKIDDWFEHTLDLSGFTITTARLQKYTTPDPGGSGPVLKLGRYRWNWLKHGAEVFHANDYTNFFGLVEALNATNSLAQFTSGLQQTINLDDFVPVIAANQFIGNYDSYGYERGKNMFLYDSAAGWQLIAWDLDNNFGSARSLTIPIDPSLATFTTEDPTMRTFLKAPLVARIFWRAMDRLAAAANDPDRLALSRAKYDALKADSTALTGSYEGFASNIMIRATNVVAQLAAANAAGLAVVDPAVSYSTSTQNVVTVTGVAPFSVTSVRINGVEVPVTWTTVSNWTAQVVLNAGTNAFVVTAYNADGTQLPGGVARSIAYTGAPLDPMEQNLCISEIMASPVTNGAAYVEIMNRSTNTLMNLTGVYLDGAAHFPFPSGTLLRPGAQLLVVENAAVFGMAYGTNLLAKVVGAYSGTLPAAGGTLLLKRAASGFEPDDPVLDRVVYEGADPWPADVPAGNSLRLINPAFDNNRVGNWTAETTLGTNVVTTPVPWGQTWRYYRTGYPGDTWSATNFDDNAWTAGAGPLGYETGTVLPVPLATSFALTGRMSYYFRTSFTYSGNPQVAALKLSYMLDDAAVFYLNGQEIARSSLMPAGAVSDATAATAAITPEGKIEGPFTLPAAALCKGTNTLAVTVHQNSTSSSDLVFGMTLDIATALTSTASPGATNTLNATLSSLPGLWLNEIQTRNVTGGADNAGEREPWVELYNSETSSVSLAGWSLATCAADPGWTFPSNTVVTPGGFLRVWLDGEPAESATNDLHAGFRFDFVSGLLLLCAPIDGRSVAVDYLRFADAAADGVWGAYPDGASNPRRWLNPATPAASNRVDKPACRIVINELMAQNDLYPNPLNGKNDDWLELFNDGTEAVNLGGYVVTDTLTSETPPTPDLRNTKSLVISNGVWLAPGQALRIWTGASKSTTLPFDPANLQAPFGLGRDGDQVCLFNPALTLVDRVIYATSQTGTASLGRWLNGAGGEWVTHQQPTPGQPNRNPRFAAACLTQPAPQSLREEQAFSHTNTFLGGRPANFVYRLYPAEAQSLPDGLAFDTATGVLNWTPAEAQGPGFHALRVCGFIADGPSVVGCDEVLLSLKVLEVPSRPILGTVTNLAVDEGATVAFTVSAARAQEIPYYATATRLRVAGSLPTNATFNADTGLFSWATGEADGPCSNSLTVIAEDVSDPSIFSATNLMITVREINVPPAYTSPATFYLWRNEPFAVHLRYGDPDLPSNRLTYSLLSGPAGLTLDPDTGLVRWQPADGQTGSFTFRVGASDNAGGEVSTTVNLSVDTQPLQASELKPGASGGGLDLRWKSKRGTRYTVEWCPDLACPAWRSLNGTELPGTGDILTYTLAPAAFGSPSNAYFRIRQTRE